MASRSRSVKPARWKSWASRWAPYVTNLGPSGVGGDDGDIDEVGDGGHGSDQDGGQAVVLGKVEGAVRLLGFMTAVSTDGC